MLRWNKTSRKLRQMLYSPPRSMLENICKTEKTNYDILDKYVSAKNKWQNPYISREKSECSPKSLQISTF
jgi:hypothetical protein